MPRQARTTSATSVYHAILRGVNKQQVFEDEEDYKRFLNVLRRQRTVMPTWYASLLLETRNMIHTMMIQNMRSAQSINICCGSEEPVPLTLENLWNLRETSSVWEKHCGRCTDKRNSIKTEKIWE